MTSVYPGMEFLQNVTVTVAYQCSKPCHKVQ